MVLEVSLQVDLTEFTAFLWRHQIPHRVIETEDSQQVWVAAEFPSEQCQQLYDMWVAGADLSQLQLSTSSASYFSSRRLQFSLSFKQQLLTLVLLLLSMLVALWTGLGENISHLKFLTIAELIERGNVLYTSGLTGTWQSGQWWRFITPAFLHFSVPHLIFNLLWLWVVGGAVERLQGRLVLLGLFFFAALSSNLAQYWVSGPLFGGMSGVVFALLGYVWLWDKTKPRIRFGFPNAMMVLMLVWLVLGFAGVLETLGLGAVANTAHLVGLLSGLVFCALVRLVWPFTQR